MKTGPTNCKHVFIDIVGYSKDRTVEAQIFIIEKLNSIIMKTIESQSIEKDQVILLPTGDGMCISFINNPFFDMHILFAIALLKNIHEYNEEMKDEKRRFKIRTGINENMDNIVIDINKKKNIAGAGINYAQRLMSLADSNMIILGTTVYEQVNRRDRYYGNFKNWRTIIKHDEILSAYQYIDKRIPFLNCETPLMFQAKVPVEIDVNISEQLAIYLVLIYKGIRVFGPLIKNQDDSKYVFVMLNYLSNYVNDHYQNSKKLVKVFSGNYLNSIFENGRKIDIKNGFKEIKQKVDYGLILMDLNEYLLTKLIANNYAEKLFIDPNSPLQLSEKGIAITEQKCKEQMDFINDIT